MIVTVRRNNREGQGRGEVMGYVVSNQPEKGMVVFFEGYRLPRPGQDIEARKYENKGRFIICSKWAPAETAGFTLALKSLTSEINNSIISMVQRANSTEVVMRRIKSVTHNALKSICSGTATPELVFEYVDFETSLARSSEVIAVNIVNFIEPLKGLLLSDPYFSLEDFKHPSLDRLEKRVDELINQVRVADDHPDRKAAMVGTGKKDDKKNEKEVKDVKADDKKVKGKEKKVRKAS